jgi:hypothetical protein
MLGAWPKRSWLQRLRKLGQDIVTAMWRRVESMSAATRSRWQLTPVIDDSVFRKYGGPLELGGGGGVDNTSVWSMALTGCCC